MQKKLFNLILITIFAFNVSAQTKNLWITTSDGGNTNDGTILMADSAGNNWQVVAQFQNFNGSYPQGSMILAADGNIYGTTRRGGVSDSCTIYKFDRTTHVITKMHDFMSSPSQGSIPYSGMILTSNCEMYGLTFDGGAATGGVIYYFDPVSNNYVDLYDFSTASGSRPFGELLELPNGMLYGMTNLGGTSGDGVIFSFEPFSQAYAVVHNFTTASGGPPAYGNLIQANNGLLYGVTKEGGSNSEGVIFSLDPVTNTFTTLHSFSNSTDGYYPFGSLMQASDGVLYGLTITGGPGGKGTLFSYDYSSNTFTMLVAFNGLNGDYAQRGLTEVSPGLLMGTTMRGGLYNEGIILTYNINAGTFTKIFDFDGTTTGGHPTSDIFMTGGPQTISCLMSIDETDPLEALSVYPNPVENGEFNISFSQNEKQIDLSIIDLQTKIVFKQVLPDVSKSSTIQIKTDLAPGIYILNLKTPNHIKSVKLFIE